MQHIRDVTDPEHPYTLEQLNVVSEELIYANDLKNSVRYHLLNLLQLHLVALVKREVIGIRIAYSRSCTPSPSCKLQYLSPSTVHFPKYRFHQIFGFALDLFLDLPLGPCNSPINGRYSFCLKFGLGYLEYCLESGAKEVDFGHICHIGSSSRQRYSTAQWPRLLDSAYASNCSKYFLPGSRQALPPIYEPSHGLPPMSIHLLRHHIFLCLDRL